MYYTNGCPFCKGIISTLYWTNDIIKRHCFNNIRRVYNKYITCETIKLLVAWRFVWFHTLVFLRHFQLILCFQFSSVRYGCKIWPSPFVFLIKITSWEELFRHTSADYQSSVQYLKSWVKRTQTQTQRQYYFYHIDFVNCKPCLLEPEKLKKKLLHSSNDIPFKVYSSLTTSDIMATSHSLF